MTSDSDNNSLDQSNKEEDESDAFESHKYSLDQSDKEEDGFDAFEKAILNNESDSFIFGKYYPFSLLKSFKDEAKEGIKANETIGQFKEKNEGIKKDLIEIVSDLFMVKELFKRLDKDKLKEWKSKDGFPMIEVSEKHYESFLELKGRLEKVLGIEVDKVTGNKDGYMLHCLLKLANFAIEEAEVFKKDFIVMLGQLESNIGKIDDFDTIIHEGLIRVVYGVNRLASVIDNSADLKEGEFPKKDRVLGDLAIIKKFLGSVKLRSLFLIGGSGSDL